MATSKQKAFCVLQFSKTESAINVQRAFRIKFGCHPPNDYNIRRWYHQFETTGCLCKGKNTLVALHFKYDFWHMTATAGLDVVQSGRPIFDDFFQHLWPYIGNNTANVVFKMVKSLWVIRIDQ
ncbi:adhesion G protein-coupled receptor B2 [Trichonephila clavipes]|nr:adhesion G protein-coupled receptor B2 [Trichonephila clavipes]